MRELPFLGQGLLFAQFVLQMEAEQFRQLGYQVCRALRVFKDQRTDAVEGVEQKMRTELVGELAQARFAHLGQQATPRDEGVGTVLGTLGGILLALNVETIVPAIKKLFQVQFMAADVYYIRELPSKLVWADVYVIAGMAFFLSLLATIYPAWQASRVNPAEVLRYE